MQPPIPAGTLLQNRYRLLKVLGQGGFGRTYLAEDLSRFNERCVVKEFIPIQGGDYALEKSRELFQREASTLYQIQHPQIPQFRANFEQGRRLFFIQDFVDGKTYNAMLEERLQAGKTFTEGEIIHLLEQTLPVLHYIHSQGMIHRDISPDNLILRESDRLPVLIDFGVVKAIAGQIQEQQVSHQGTTVGKLGYSPSEQLQTGKVYPNSDLYALAVTAVVLMTGKQPQDLLDEATMTWHWQQRVPSLSPRLAQVLMRMMNPRPSNRYESASEVLQALRSLTGLVQPAAAPSILMEASQVPSSPPRPTTATLPTPAKAEGSATYIQSNRTQKPTSPPTWLPWMIGSIVLLVIALLPSVVIHFVLLGNRPQPSIQPSPTSPELPPLETSPSPGESPVNPTASPETTQVEAEDVGISPEQPKVAKSGKVSVKTSKRYVVTLAEGQGFSVGITQGAVALEVRDPIGVIVSPGGSTAWQTSPTSRLGTYEITVSSVPETDFTVEFNLQGGTPAPTSPPVSPPVSPSPSLPTPSSPPPSPPLGQPLPSPGQQPPPGQPFPPPGGPPPSTPPIPPNN